MYVYIYIYIYVYIYIYIYVFLRRARPAARHPMNIPLILFKISHYVPKPVVTATCPLIMHRKSRGIDTYVYIYIYICIHTSIYIYLSIYLSLSLYIYIYTYVYTTYIQRGLRGSQGMGVVSNNWFDGVLLSTLHVFKPSC